MVCAFSMAGHLHALAAEPMEEVPELPWDARGIILAVAILSITLHEAGHAFMADRLGDSLPRRLGKVTLNPIAHIKTTPFMTLVLPVLTWVMYQGYWAFGGGACPVSPDWIYSRRKSFLVAAAGPAVNAALLIFFTICFFLPFLADSKTVAFQLLFYLVVMEFFIMLFNLFPIPPMDGSYMLMAVFPSLLEPFLKAQRFGFMLVVFVGWPLFEYVGPPLLGGWMKLIVFMRALVFG